MEPIICRVRSHFQNLGLARHRNDGIARDVLPAKMPPQVRDATMTRNDPRIKSDLAKAFALSLARRRKLGLSLAPVSFDRYLEVPSI
jgi:hypothetical protein